MTSPVDQFRMQNLETRLGLRRLTCVHLAVEIDAAMTVEQRRSLTALWEKSNKDVQALEAALEGLKRARECEREAHFDLALRA